MNNNLKEGISDLIPGLVASAAFLVMLLILGFHNWWLAGLLSAATYFAFRFILHKDKINTPIQSTPNDALIAIRGYTRHISSKDIVSQIDALTNRANDLIRYFNDQPSYVTESSYVIQQYLDMVKNALHQYVKTTNRLGKANQETQKALQELIVGVKQRFDGLYDKLASDDNEQLSTEIQMMNKTIKELDDVWLQARRTE